MENSGNKCQSYNTSRNQQERSKPFHELFLFSPSFLITKFQMKLKVKTCLSCTLEEISWELGERQPGFFLTKSSKEKHECMNFTLLLHENEEMSGWMTGAPSHKHQRLSQLTWIWSRQPTPVSSSIRYTIPNCPHNLATRKGFINY